MYPDGPALDFAKSILFLDRKVQVLSTVYQRTKCFNLFAEPILSGKNVYSRPQAAE
jgi:hypothetical protein